MVIKKITYSSETLIFNYNNLKLVMSGSFDRLFNVLKGKCIRKGCPGFESRDNLQYCN